MVKSVTYHTKVPRDKAVNNTPKVDKTSPSRRIGFTAVQLVSSPPEKQNKVERYYPNELSNFRVIKMNAANSVRTRQHADCQKEQ